MLLSVTLVGVRMIIAHGRMIVLVKMIAHVAKTIAMMIVRIVHVKITAMMIVRIAHGVIVMMIVRIVLAAMMMIAKTIALMVAGVVRIASPHRMLILPVRSATFTATQPVTAGGVVVMTIVMMTVLCKVTVGTWELTLPLMVLTPIGTMIQGLLITLLAS
jgi:hypothetical protein